MIKSNKLFKGMPLRDSISTKIFASLALFFLINTFSHAQWISGYSYRKEITINSTYIQENLVDFSFYFKISDPNFTSTGNVCDNIKSVDGFDFIFTDEGGAPLDHEIIDYDESIGEYEVWINVPNISAVADTKIYLFHGNNTSIVDPSTSSTWSSNNEAVFHFDSYQDGDATSNENHLDPSLFSIDDEIDGLIGSALQFDGVSQSASRVYDTDFDNETFTISGWIKPDVKNGGGNSLQVASQAMTGWAEEAINLGSIIHDDSDLELVRNPSLNDFILTGLKFDLNVTQSTQIEEAYLEFVASETVTSFAQVFINLENSLTPIDYDGLTNKPSDRSVTANQVVWNSLEWNEGSVYRTPDLSGQIQGMVNNGGWSNQLAFLIDGFGERPTDNSIKLVVVYEGAGTSSFEVSVLDNLDDVEELTDGTTKKGTPLSFDPNGVSDADVELIGLHFENIAVPSGALVESAYVEFVSFGNYSGSVEADIWIENVGQSQPFQETSTNVSSREKIGPVNWNLPTWTEDNAYSTPEMKSLLQSIIDREDWQSGNDISIIMEPIAAESGKRRQAYHVGSGVPANVPKLVVNFSLPKSESQVLLSRYNSEGFELAINETGNLTFGVDDGSGLSKIESQKGLLDDSWHHFAAVKDGVSSFSLYVDGVHQGTKTPDENYLIIPIANGVDDAEQNLSSGGVSVGDNNFQLNHSDYTGQNQTCGLNFRLSDDLKGTEIISASLQLVSTQSGDGSAVVEISGFLGDMQPFPTSDNNSYITDLISNSGSTSRVDWDIPEFVSARKTYSSPDISAIIQEIVDDVNYSNGGDIGLFLASNGLPNERELKSYENDPNAAMTLFIQYRESDFGSITGSTPDLIIGDDGTNTTNYYGSIDEIIIRDDALSSNEINAAYKNVKAPNFYSITDEAIVTWTNGSGNLDWNDPLNWSTGLAPWNEMDYQLGADARLTSMIRPGRLSSIAGSKMDLNGNSIELNCDCQVDELTSGEVIIKESLTIGSVGGGEVIIDELTIDPDKDLTISSDMRLNSSLIFNGNGKVYSNGNTILLSNNLMNDAYSSTSLNRTIVLDNAGSLVVENVADGEIAVLNTSLDGTAGTYSRIELENRNGESVSFSVSQCEDVYSDGTCDGGNGGSLATSNGVDLTWNVTSSKNSDAMVDATFYWHSDMEMAYFNRTEARINHYNASLMAWEELTSLSATTDLGDGIFSIDGHLTSFSPYGVGQKDILLPVSLIYFDARAKKNAIEIEWRTASELNNNYYLLEKSVDGSYFQSLDTIEGAGTSSKQKAYIFSDKNPIAGTQYYRLSQIDYDGTKSDLGIKRVDWNGQIPIEFSLFPSPASKMFQVSNLNQGSYVLEVTGIDGRTVLVKSFSTNSLTDVLKISIEDLDQGIYLVKIGNGEATTTKKLIVEK